jgi:hypothetical protein
VLLHASERILDNPGPRAANSVFRFPQAPRKPARVMGALSERHGESAPPDEPGQEASSGGRSPAWKDRLGCPPVFPLFLPGSTPFFVSRPVNLVQSWTASLSCARPCQRGSHITNYDMSCKCKILARSNSQTGGDKPRKNGCSLIGSRARKCSTHRDEDGLKEEECQVTR